MHVSGSRLSITYNPNPSVAVEELPRYKSCSCSNSAPKISMVLTQSSTPMADADLHHRLLFFFGTIMCDKVGNRPRLGRPKLRCPTSSDMFNWRLNFRRMWNQSWWGLVALLLSGTSSGIPASTFCFSQGLCLPVLDGMWFKQ